jgi:hypothetical protein
MCSPVGKALSTRLPISISYFSALEGQMPPHLVAIPVSQFQLNGDKLVLPGATKDALKAAPEFEYAN